MKSGIEKSFRNRAKSQRGNVIVYLLAFGVLWFVFFAVKGWIKDTKDARYKKPELEQSYDDPYLEYSRRAG